MTYMEKFFELFKRNLTTERLEMRILEPTQENAQLVWDAVKNENAEDFKYAPMVQNGILPESETETLQMMQKHAEWCHNGVDWYVFYDNNLVGYQRIHYWPENRTIQCSDVWFLKRYWGQGFNQEIHKKIEEIAFEKLHANRICRQCMKDNVNSFKSITKSGFHHDGDERQSYRAPDGTFLDQCRFSKLASEYDLQNKKDIK